MPPPQDPVIFSGSVRSNLDPFGDAGSDERIWGALSQVRRRAACAATCACAWAVQGAVQGTNPRAGREAGLL